FTAHAAIDAVRGALPREGLLAFDVGAHTHQIASQWSAHAPKTFHITNGWSSMGFGLPGAIAAKLARPEAPVVWLLGDGCFQMTGGEVATAKRLGITLPVVVLDDRWLALIKVKQIRRQFPLYGTELQAEAYREPPAHYFGVPAVAANSADTLEAAVKTALAANGPTVIEAVVDSEHYIDTVYDGACGERDDSLLGCCHPRESGGVHIPEPVIMGPRFRGDDNPTDHRISSAAEMLVL